MDAIARALSPSRTKDKPDVQRTSSPPLPPLPAGDVPATKERASSPAVDSSVNWQDVLKDTRKKDDAVSPKASSARAAGTAGKRAPEIRFETPVSPKDASLDTTMERRSATMGAATGRTVSPFIEKQPLIQSTPARGLQIQNQSDRAPRGTTPHETVMLQRDRLQSSAIYVAMPSPHQWPLHTSAAWSQQQLRSSPDITQEALQAAVKRRGPEDALKEWRTLVSMNRVEEARSFIESMGRDLDVNLACKGRRTALHTAAEAGNVALTKLLISSGADRQAKDGSGRTASELTTNAELIELLAPISTSSLASIAAVAVSASTSASASSPSSSSPPASTSSRSSTASQDARDDLIATLHSDWGMALSGRNAYAIPDVFLCSGDTKVPVHRLIIAARAPELASLLPPPALPSAPIPTLPLKCAARPLEYLVAFIYLDYCHGAESLDGAELAELFACAHAYKLVRLSALLVPLLPLTLLGDNLIKFLKTMATSQLSTQVREIALALAAREFKNLNDEQAEQLLLLGKLSLQIAANSANPPPVPAAPTVPERTIQRDLAALLDGRIIPCDAALGGLPCHSLVLSTRCPGCDVGLVRSHPISGRAAKTVLRYLYSAELDCANLSPVESFEVLDCISLLLPDVSRRPPSFMQHLSTTALAGLDSTNCTHMYLLASRPGGPEHDLLKRAALKTLLVNFPSRTVAEDFVAATNTSPAVAEVLLGLSAALAKATGASSPPVGSPPLMGSPRENSSSPPPGKVGSPRKEKERP